MGSFEVPIFSGHQRFDIVTDELVGADAVAYERFEEEPGTGGGDLGNDA